LAITKTNLKYFSLIFLAKPNNVIYLKRQYLNGCGIWTD
jgi:hypothetical protein